MKKCIWCAEEIQELHEAADDLEERENLQGGRSYERDAPGGREEGGRLGAGALFG